MYVNKCTKCGSEFETKNPKRVICPNCLYPDRTIPTTPTITKEQQSTINPTQENQQSQSTDKNIPDSRNKPTMGSQPRNYQDQDYRNDRPRGNYDRPRSNYDRPRSDYDRPRNDYDRPRNDYDRPRSNYDRPRSDQDRPRTNYDRQSSGYNRPHDGDGYNRSPDGDGYNRQPGGYNRPNTGYNRPRSDQDRPRGNYDSNRGNRPPSSGGMQRNQQPGMRRPGPGGPPRGNRPPSFRPGGRRPPMGDGGPRKLLVNRDQLIQIENLYKTMLPLPNPDVHDVIGKEIDLEPRKVFFGINLIRQKMKLPKLPFPKRRLAVSSDQLMAVESLYTPLLPLPPIGCHKIIAKQLKMDEWRVHVAIGIIRKQKNLPRWNPDRDDAPEEFKKQRQEELAAEAIKTEIE